MRLTPWQVLGVVVSLALVWAVYEYWWKYQDQTTWIRGMNDSMYSTDADDEPMDTGRKKKDDWL